MASWPHWLQLLTCGASYPVISQDPDWEITDLGPGRRSGRYDIRFRRFMPFKPQAMTFVLRNAPKARLLVRPVVRRKGFTMIDTSRDQEYVPLWLQVLDSRSRVVLNVNAPLGAWVYDYDGVADPETRHYYITPGWMPDDGTLARLAESWREVTPMSVVPSEFDATDGELYTISIQTRPGTQFKPIALSVELRG